MKRFTSLCEGSSDEETISPSKKKSISKEERKTEQTTIDDHFRTSRTLKRIPTPTKKKPSPKKDNQYTLLHNSAISTCPICGTLFDSDNVNDVKAHKRICQEFQNGIKATSLPSSLKSIQEFENGDSILVDPSFTSHAYWKSLEVCITKECGEIRDSPNRKAFLFIHNNKVTAAAITAIPDDTSTSLMNIIALWTAIQWRRKGMASQLITTVANKSRYSLIIRKMELSFGKRI